MKLAPSILAADFARLLEEAQQVADLSDYLHFDVMDGHFVPNLTFGPPIVNALKNKLKTPSDIHLMITDPKTYAPQFRVTQGDLITFHIEAMREPIPVIETIKSLGAKVGIALKPTTPITAIKAFLGQIDVVLVMGVEPGFSGQEFIQETLPKIRQLKSTIKEKNPALEIEVDGGIHLKNIKEIVEAGADIVVAASAVFGQKDRRKAIEELKRAARPS